MPLYYSEKFQVKITILDYINEIMECLDKVEPKAIGTKNISTPLNLFVFDEDRGKLIKKKS